MTSTDRPGVDGDPVVKPELPPDLANLPRFLKHLRPRDRAAAQFAGELLDDGASVLTFWGPEMMDVWRLELQRGGWTIRFGIERGFADGVVIAASGSQQWWGVELVLLAWAGAQGIPARVLDPLWLTVDVDLAAHGLAALDWLQDGHRAEVDRVRLVWEHHRDQVFDLRRRTPGDLDTDELKALAAAGSQELERAATGAG